MKRTKKCYNYKKRKNSNNRIFNVKPNNRTNNIVYIVRNKIGKLENSSNSTKKRKNLSKNICKIVRKYHHRKFVISKIGSMISKIYKWTRGIDIEK